MRLLTFLFILLTALPAAADSDPPNGAVVLTVTANIPQLISAPAAFDLPSDHPATKVQEGKGRAFSNAWNGNSHDRP